MYNVFLDEKAVQFAQAEKLYYEAALINSATTTSTTQSDENNVTHQNVIR